MSSYFFLFDIHGIVHKELVKPLVTSFIVTFWSGWGSVAEDRLKQTCRNGRTIIGFSFTHHLFVWWSLTSKTTIPFFAGLGPHDCFLFPMKKLQLKGAVLCKIHTQMQEILNTHIWELLGMCGIMRKKCWILCRQRDYSRGLHLRRYLKLGCYSK